VCVKGPAVSWRFHYKQEVEVLHCTSGADANKEPV
jgi:hypothetical protein